MTKEEIVKLAVENDLVVEVYDMLHQMVMTQMDSLRDKLNSAEADLRLIEKFAAKGRLDVIDDILNDRESL